MSTAEIWTIGRLLQWTTDFLRQHGSESARLDAEILLATARGTPRIALYTAFDEAPPEPVRQAFRELVKRRAAGEPVAYLVGTREFYSLRFRVTPEVLIPRPETEHLVVALLDQAKARQLAGASTPPRIVDVGTGSGVIAVCAAKYLPEAEISATDRSPAALAIAAENATQHGLAERIRFIEGDLLAQVPAGERFDFVVSNPPYISEAEMAELSRDVRDYEPAAALCGGPTGAEVIARLVPQAAERLTPGGWLMIEISPQLEDRVRAILLSTGEFEAPRTIKDLAGRGRVIIARRGGPPAPSAEAAAP